jgi:CheY-like chemotaxis protein
LSILIVEDEEPIREIIAEILEGEGYLVVGVSNGLEALAYLRDQANATGLILLDLGMPVMTGWEFREEQLRDPALATIPVIVMSAWLSLNQNTAPPTATAYLGKPIELEALLGVVERYYQ